MICPFGRYYICHSLVALAIALILWLPFGLHAGLTAGGAFYAGREYTQWEGGLPFDWKGAVAPIGLMFTLFVLSKLVGW